MENTFLRRPERQELVRREYLYLFTERKRGGLQQEREEVLPGKEGWKLGRPSTIVRGSG